MKAYLIYENEEWLPPFHRAMEREGVPVEPWFVHEGRLDLAAPPPEGVFVNRISPSSHTRGHRESVPFARELLAWLEAHGRRVINGSRAFALEVSKTRQCTALRAAGLRTPRTVAVVGGAEPLKRAARSMPTPFIVKHNCGGTGNHVRLVHSVDELDLYVDSPLYQAPTDHVTILQEYVRSREPAVTRVEIVGGELLYAMRVSTASGFELCPADGCRIGEDGSACPLEAADGERFTLIPGFQHPLVPRYVQFMHRNGIDVAGLEFIEDERGRAYTYDVNATTNYAPHIAERHGLDGPAAVARLVAREMRAARRRGVPGPMRRVLGRTRRVAAW